jgi:Fe-S-cluster containining protein
MNPAAFEAKYVYRTAYLLRLRKPRGAQCHFLDEKGCALHPAKPAQCRIFPFWPEIVESREAWLGLSSYCPGIGKGAPVPASAVLRLSAQMREAYPGMY